jgi:cell division protein FtsZ
MEEAVTSALEHPSSRDSEVTIAPLAPDQTRYATEIDVEMDLAPDTEPAPSEGHFIPPAAEVPPTKMPRVEDFPPVVQRQLEQRSAPPAQEEDRGPLSLLRRLANVGLGRREEEPPAQAQRTEPPPPVRPAQRPPQPPQAQRREAPPPPPDYGKRPPAPRAATPEGMYRPRAGDLDPHGRPLPQQRMTEDELEIPAFLRRQAN